MGGCYAIVVAAGRGSRLGGEIPKQYRKLGRETVLAHSVRRFSRHPAIQGVRVVIHPDDRGLYDDAVRGLELMDPVAGGQSRQESVRNGIESLAVNEPDYVIIHDAARPFVTAECISAARAALAEAPGALVAVPVVDTLKRAADGIVGGTIDRSGLWRAQTPQAFRYKEIREAHRRATGMALTDDAAVAEHAGIKITLVPGSEDNFKITTEDDLRRAARLMDVRPMATRTGIGFDVHAFGPGDHLWLCGVRVPFSRGLVGHSDADVALHALTDAVLGALADGDIGAHFSDKDPRWRGAASDLFLRHAIGLVVKRGGRVVHLDVTLICEQPRIRPLHGVMVDRIAAIADLKPTRVSVKATTTERLGFTGREEGIAAQAVATVSLPDDE